MKKINPVHLQYICLIQKRLAIFHKGNNPFSFAVNVTNIAWLSTVCNYAYLLTVLAWLSLICKSYLYNIIKYSVLYPGIFQLKMRTYHGALVDAVQAHYSDMKTHFGRLPYGKYVIFSTCLTTHIMIFLYNWKYCFIISG